MYLLLYIIMCLHIKNTWSMLRVPIRILFLHYSHGKIIPPVNVARLGEATQESLANGGVATRAIDGDTNGDYWTRTRYNIKLVHLLGS